MESECFGDDASKMCFQMFGFKPPDTESALKLIIRIQNPQNITKHHGPVDVGKVLIQLLNLFISHCSSGDSHNKQTDSVLDTLDYFHEKSKEKVDDLHKSYNDRSYLSSEELAPGESRTGELLPDHQRCVRAKYKCRQEKKRIPRELVLALRPHSHTTSMSREPLDMLSSLLLQTL